MRLIDADKLKQHYAWWNDESCERANINFCPMCGRDLRKEDEGK